MSTDPAAADPAPAPRRDPLAALRRIDTVRARCAAVTRAVADGASGSYKLAPDGVERLAQRLLAVAAEPDTPRDDNPWTLPSPGADGWPAMAAADAGDAGWLARADLAVLMTLLDDEAIGRWHLDVRGEAGAVDRLALPAERHAAADLFAMLDRFAPAAAPPAAAAAVADPVPASTAPVRRLTGREALAAACRRALEAGVFSSAPGEPLRADAGALRRIDAASLRAAFQVSGSNPWPGLEARAAALARAGQWLADEAARDGGPARLARWVTDSVDAAGAAAGGTPATALAAWLARRLAPGWPDGATVLGLPAGDAAPHTWAGADTGAPGLRDAPTGGWVPLHRGAQSLVRLLAPVLAVAGRPVTGLDRLADASDDRHVACLLAEDVLRPRAREDLARPLGPRDARVVEARAAAVTLLAAACARAREQAAPGAALPADDDWIERLCRRHAGTVLPWRPAR